MGFLLDMWKRDRNIRKNKREQETRRSMEAEKAREQEKLEAQLPGLIAATDDPALLCRYYRQTRAHETRFAIAEKITAPEPRMQFGGMDWFVLEETEGRKLLLSRYLLEKCLPYDDGLEPKKNYEGEGYYITYPKPQWHLSRLREYLSTEFMDRFAEDEKSRIVPVHITDNSDRAVCLDSREKVRSVRASRIDRVFALSEAEIMHYAERSAAVRTAFMKNGRSGYGYWTRDASDATSFEGHGEWKSAAVYCRAGEDPLRMPEFGAYPCDESRYVRPAVWITDS